MDSKTGNLFFKLSKVAILFLSIVLVLNAFSQGHSNSKEDEKLPAIQSWSGIRMITLGTRYMTEVPLEAKSWLKKNESVLDGDIDKISESVVNGFISAGKVLIIMGAAKEYRDYFDFQGNPQNPMNKFPRHVVEARQVGRLKRLSAAFSILNRKLKSQNIDAAWLADIFDSKTQDNSITQASLGKIIGQVGGVLEKFNVYGIGIEIVSDVAIGSMITAVLPKKLQRIAEKTGSKLNYEGAKGVVYVLKKKSLDVDPDEEEGLDEEMNDPFYSDIPKDDPIWELMRGDKYRFAATTYSQNGARVEGSTLTTGNGPKHAAEIGVSVRVSFFSSANRLPDFDLLDLDGTDVAEVKAKQNVTNALNGSAKALASTAQDLIENAVDNGKHFSFLKENILLSAGHIRKGIQIDFSDDDDADPKAVTVKEVPEFLFRVTVGNYSKALGKDRGFSGLFEASGAFGKISIHAKPN